MSCSLFPALLSEHWGCAHGQGWARPCECSRREDWTVPLCPGFSSDQQMDLSASHCPHVSVLFCWCFGSCERCGLCQKSLLAPHISEQKFPDSLAFQSEREGRSVHKLMWDQQFKSVVSSNQKIRTLFSTEVKIPNICHHEMLSGPGCWPWATLSTNGWKWS